MHFIHEPYIPGQTIAAIATPPGSGGVAIIRISGYQAIHYVSQVFSGPIHTYKTHTAHYGKIIDEKGDKVDDVLCLVMLKNRSYTGEETVEIYCHGGSLVTKKVFETIMNTGVRAARPGEFTFKAFMNGRLDLAEAESVQELIAAKNEQAFDSAKNQLEGTLSKKIDEFQKRITYLAAILEAYVDFPEEGLEFQTTEEMCHSLKQIMDEMQDLIESYHDGKILHEGLTLSLIGCPNVGKSSLMNALLNKERAIVSDRPGTTRDTLEDQLLLNGLNFKLIDTAGIRETEEEIEQEGIKRSHATMDESDLILLVFDGSSHLTEEDHLLAKRVPPEKTIVILNKADIKEPSQETFAALKEFPHLISISAKTKLHLKELHKKIDEVIWKKGVPAKDELILTNVRHFEALKKSFTSLKSVLEGLKRDISPEFLTSDIKESLRFLGQIIGQDVPDEILSAIFSNFCIGK